MHKNRFFSVLVPLISVLLAFLVGCIIMAALKANPGTALKALWKGAFGSTRSVGTTLSRATPLIFTSLCACFAYRCGVFNLGGEGQFLMGSIVCCYVATQSGITGLPGIILCIVAGGIAGGLWAAVPGLLKVYRGQNEMIISIMLNYVATLFMGVIYTNWLREGSVPQTMSVPNEVKLTKLFGLRCTSAFVIAVVIGLMVYYFLFYTSKGFQLRAVGLNMTASEFNGFAVKRYILLSFIRRRGHGAHRSAPSPGGDPGGHLLRGAAGGFHHHAGGHRRAHQRVRDHPGLGHRVHSGRPCHGEAAGVQGVS